MKLTKKQESFVNEKNINITFWQVYLNLDNGEKLRIKATDYHDKDKLLSLCEEEKE